MDKLTRSQRSALMARIKGKNTMPEMLVRSAAHRLGLRFSLHRKDLKGSPDIVFPKHHTVVFVHGCFWHQHAGCRRASVPTSRADYWKAKLARNKERDAQAAVELKAAGWRVAVIWECDVKNADKLNAKLKRLFHRALGQKTKMGTRR